MTKPITVPALSLVVLVGASGSGTSNFARRHFKPTEILSSDACRAMVADDENDQSATGPAFEVLHFIAAKRLAAGRLTFVASTTVSRPSRRSRCTTTSSTSRTSPASAGSRRAWPDASRSAKGTRPPRSR